MTHLFNLILVQVACARVWLPAGTSLFYVDTHQELLILVRDVHAEHGGRLSPDLHLAGFYCRNSIYILFVFENCETL